MCQSLVGVTSDKGKPDESQGRKATGPRFLRNAMDDLPKDPRSPSRRDSSFMNQTGANMKIRTLALNVAVTVAACLLNSSVYAGKPEISRDVIPFDLGPLVECDGFEVYTTGLERDTLKLWFDADGNPVRLQVQILILESKYYNTLDPDNKFVTQGKNGVGENVTLDLEVVGVDPDFGFLIFGDRHEAGAAFRLTLPGIGHVVLHVGTWFYDASEDVLIHKGPDFVLAEGESAPALCEALQ